MALPLRISTDTAGLERKLQQKMARVPRATAAGINKTAERAYTLAVREIQKNVGSTAQKDIRKFLKLNKAFVSKFGAKERLFATIEAKSRKKDRIRIYEMGPKPKNVTKKRPAGGVSYGPQNKLLKGAFIVQFGNKRKGVFTRLGRSRFPIVENRGPSVALVFKQEAILSKVNEFIRAKLPEELKRAYRFFTGGGSQAAA